MQNIDINQMLWHDGNLVKTLFHIESNGQSRFIIIADLYESEQSSERIRFTVTCSQVMKCSLSLDALELEENMFAGNISNGYMKRNSL